jgi:hypothetical protein
LRLSPRSATAAALAVSVVGIVALGVPAAAHSPRDARPGGPRMDLEVLVTPPITGSVSPGGRDAVVTVDAFGNRFAMARKEVATGLVAPDPRARTMARANAWHWYSDDEGATWENLDLLPRGAEVALPEQSDRAVASAGPRSYLAEVGRAGAVVVPVLATRRGRFTAERPGVVPLVTTQASRPSLAAHGSSVFLATGGRLSPESQLYSSHDAGASWSTERVLLPGTSCDVAADPRKDSRVVVVACLDGGEVVLHSSRDDGKTFTGSRLGSADTRGGDAGAPSVDISAEGVPTVLSGLLLRRVLPGRTTVQDLRSEKGAYRATTLAVSDRGRVGVAAYRLLPGTDGWNVVVTVLTPGRSPVWADFAFHDPAGRSAAAGPPSDRLSADMDPRGRVHVLWTATRLHSAELDSPLLRNVWSVRSTTP